MRRSMLSGMVLLACSLAGHAAPRPREFTLQALPAPARELFASSMRLADASFDPARHLIRNPPAGPGHDPGHFAVRESAWYALGLLERDAPGDRATAAAILDAVLAQQYSVPGHQWYGTFRRSPEEPEPPTGAIAFQQYDPNWRHFIGTIFELMLARFPERLPAALLPRLYASIDLSIEGELQDGRLKESYSNIALMYGALWDFAAAHNHRAAWQLASARWNRTVYALFREHNSFAEYNSPTYYGVDLYGLALWRTLGTSAEMRSMGSRMEAALWNDIAAFYQPRLRNISGPYDRSYGMDMESYVSVIGVWLRSVLPAAQAPLPEALTLTTDHIGDLWFTPQIVLLGARIPATAMQGFTRSTAPHLVSRVIDQQRVATAWIGTTAIWGGEATSFTRDAGPPSQFHPATAQWRTPSGSVGWLLVTRAPKLNATATEQGIAIATATAGDLTIRIATGLRDASGLSATLWNLPGMQAQISTDGSGFSTAPVVLPSGVHAIDVTYRNVRHLTLSLQPAASAKP